MAITLLRLVHATSDEKVAEVKAEMRVLGPPKIRVVDCADYYMAIEGCHRLTAAAELKIKPVLIVLAPDDLVEVDSLETDFFPSGETYTARKIANAYWEARNPVLTINPDGTLMAPAKFSEEDETSQEW